MTQSADPISEGSRIMVDLQGLPWVKGVLSNVNRMGNYGWCFPLLFKLILSLYNEHSIMTINITEGEKKKKNLCSLPPYFLPPPHAPVRKQLGFRVWAVLWGPSHLLRKGRSCSAWGWGGGLIAAARYPSRAKSQHRAIQEGSLEAEEAALTWKCDDVGTWEEPAPPAPFFWELPALGLGLGSPVPVEGPLLSPRAFEVVDRQDWAQAPSILHWEGARRSHLDFWGNWKLLKVKSRVCFPINNNAPSLQDSCCLVGSWRESWLQ